LLAEEIGRAGPTMVVPYSAGGPGWDRKMVADPQGGEHQGRI